MTELLGLQKKIHRYFEAQARRLLGPTPASIAAYEKAAKRDFKSVQLKPVTLEALFDQVNSARVTLLADFHSFAQSQRTALRILRQCRSKNWILGLEAIEMRHQELLDELILEKITEEAFRVKSGFDERWGFSWESTAKLLRLARERGWKALALGSSGNQKLKLRDQSAARRIAEALTETRRSRIFVLFGELHVASRHLPREIRRVARVQPLVLHQNQDPLYWKLAEKGLHPQAVKLAAKTYCVFSGTPWAKLHSLIQWAEEGPSDLDEGEEPDYLEAVKAYTIGIAEVLELPTDDSSSLSVASLQDLEKLEKLPLKPPERHALAIHAAWNLRLYIPRVGLGYLALPSQNGAAEIAAVRLWRELTRSESVAMKTRDDFFRFALQGAFGFFGSLLINPKRKCDLKDDHEERMLELRTKSGIRAVREFRARKLALQLFREPRSRFEVAELRSLYLASVFLGRMQGFRLYRALLAKKTNLKSIRNLFFTAKREWSAEDRYHALLKTVEGTRIRHSKTHHF